MLHGEATGVRQGIRIVAPTGEALAWWGEDLRTPGTTSFEFDATHLYIVRSPPLPNPAVSVQAFERLPNHPKSRSLFDPDDDWVVGTMFHAGVLRQEPGSLRFVLERRPSATLWIDVGPRAKPDVIQSVRALGNGIAAILLALSALAVLWGVGCGVWGVGDPEQAGAEPSKLPPPTPHSLLPTAATILLVIAARASLLPMHVD